MRGMEAGIKKSVDQASETSTPPRNIPPAIIPATRPIQRRVLWLGLVGFSLTIIGCWLTELLDPPTNLHQMLGEAGVIALLGFFTIRWTLRLCAQLELTAGELHEKNQRLHEKTMHLEASRRKLLELDHMKSDFVAMVSHELRTPLTSIIGFANTLQSLPLAADQHKKYLGIIESEGRRLAEMVEEFLDVSRIEAGTFDLRLAPIIIHNMLQEVVEPLHLATKVHIEVKLDPSSPSTLTGDINRLKRVLLNLLANAVRYTAEGTSVEVSTVASDNGVTFHVRDHGPGLTKYAQEHVFERFYRGSDNITVRSHGSGLGLYIAKAVVQKHGGRLWVESQHGHGATFSFWLPMGNAGACGASLVIGH